LIGLYAMSNDLQLSVALKVRPPLLTQCCVMPRCFTKLWADVDVDSQYIGVSAIWTLTTPVPWDATCDS
jgi:hypothetical protein